MTKDQAAKAAGLVVYDVAVPQQWIETTARHIVNRLYISYDTAYVTLLSGVVWCYDRDKVFCHPIAVTEDAKEYQRYF